MTDTQHTPANLWSAAGMLLDAQEKGPVLRRTDFEGPRPLSFAQERVWLLSSSGPGPSYYNVPLGWWVDGKLREDWLQAALDAMLRRHETLRTRFLLHKGAPCAETMAPTSMPLGILRIRERTPQEWRLSALEAARQECRRPFDVTAGPMIRAFLADGGAHGQLLLLITHQAVVDGWSLRLLSQDLASCYSALCERRPLPARAQPVGYGDFATWQRRVWEDTTIWEEQLDHWRTRLAAPYRRLDLPYRDARRYPETGPSLRLPFQISSEVTSPLRHLAQQGGVSLFAVALASLGALLVRYTGQTDTMVFVSAASRNRPEIKKVVGLFANVLPLRCDLSGDPEIGEIWRRVNEVTLSAFANQSVPFERLMEMLMTGADADDRSIVQVMMRYQNTPVPKLTLPGAGLTPGDEIATGLAKSDLSLDIVEEPGGLKGYLEFRADRFDEEVARRMARNWQLVLRGFAGI